MHKKILKNVLGKIKKYNFIILFSVAFLTMFAIVAVNEMSVNKISGKDSEKSEPQVAYENTGENNKSRQKTENDTKASEGDQTFAEGTIQNQQPGESVTQEAPSKNAQDVTTVNAQDGNSEQSQQAQPETTTAPDSDRKESAEFTTVDMSYLDGALFIGDSRTVTLASYANWSNTTFFVETGLTIWKVMDREIANVNGTTMSVRDALKTNKYDKIYIMLGVNELGTGTSDSFCKQYRSVIDEIRQLQPDAVIYIQSIMHVAQNKDDENSYINNAIINERNNKIKGIADNVHVIWIDDNEAFDAPGTGKLNSEYTSDGVHLKPKYIPVWQDFLLTHAVKK